MINTNQALTFAHEQLYNARSFGDGSASQYLCAVAALEWACIAKGTLQTTSHTAEGWAQMQQAIKHQEEAKALLQHCVTSQIDAALG